MDIGIFNHRLHAWRITYAAIQEIAKWSRTSPPSSSASPPEWAALLQPEAILAACGEMGHKAWRHRVLTPVTTIELFLLQILHGNTE